MVKTQFYRILARLSAVILAAAQRLRSTFPLHEEYFRIPRTEDEDRQWKEKLAKLSQPNVLTDADVAAYALQVDQVDGTPTSGFVIAFLSVIENGKNFFDKPLPGGDNRTPRATSPPRPPRLVPSSKALPG